MYVVIIAWGYVVLLMAVAEAISSQGTVLGAFFTLLLYGVLPLSIVVYILGTPGRKRARAAREAQEAQEAMASADDDAGSQAAVGATGPVAAKREEA
jgi:mannose/fructose/N-acetylgalactosamine-specific phosphotransferase system component IID